MRSSILLILILLIAAPESFGRSRRSSRVPLLPERHHRVANNRYRPVAVNTQYRSNYDVYANPQKTDNGLGFELGAMLRKNNTAGIGLELVPGGRFVTDFYLGNRWHLRPTAGFFFKSSGEGAASVSEYHIEVGASMLYDVAPRTKSHFYLGGAVRFDGAFASIKAFESSDSTPLAIQLRTGPILGFEWHTGRDTSFLLNFESTFNLSENFKFYGGLTAGFLFRTW